MTVPITIVGLTDTGFTFDATLTEPGTYDLVGTTGGVEVVREPVAITVTSTAAVTITEIEPPCYRTAHPNDPAQWPAVATNFTVTGTGLLAVESLQFKGAFNTDDFLAATFTTHTDTEITFTATIQADGLRQLLAFAGGLEIARLNYNLGGDWQTTFVDFSPKTIPANTPTTITVTGCGMGTTEWVQLRGTGSGQNAGDHYAPLATTHVTKYGNTENELTFVANVVNGGDYAIQDCPAGGEGTGFSTGCSEYLVVTPGGTPPTTLLTIAPLSTYETLMPLTYTLTWSGADPAWVAQRQNGGEYGYCQVTVTGPGTGTFLGTMGPSSLNDENWLIEAIDAGYSPTDIQPTPTSNSLPITVIQSAPPPPPAVTAVTPADPPLGQSTFTVVGSGLAAVDGGRLEGPVGGSIPITVSGVSDTGLTFTATIAVEDTYALILTIAGADAVEDAPPVVAEDKPVITSVTPGDAVLAISNTHTVVGTDLIEIDGADFFNSSPTVAIHSNVTDTGLTLVWTPNTEGTYDLRLWSGGSMVATLENCVAVTQGPPTILTVVPGAAAAGANTTYTVTGRALLDVAKARLENATNSTPEWTTTGADATGFQFSAIVGNAGVYDLVALDMMEAELCRLAGIVTIT